MYTIKGHVFKSQSLLQEHFDSDRSRQGGRGVY